MTRGGWRLLRELLGGALILAIWIALWTWTVGLVLQPWHAADAPVRPAAVERA